jgi:hypothetical protein
VANHPAQLACERAQQEKARQENYLRGLHALSQEATAFQEFSRLSKDIDNVELVARKSGLYAPAVQAQLEEYRKIIEELAPTFARLRAFH